MKKIITLLIFLLIFGISVALIKHFTTPSELSEQQKNRIAQEILGRPLKKEQPGISGEQTYDGKYIKFNWPKAAVEYKRPTDSKPSSNELEYFSFQENSSRLFFVAFVTNAQDLKRIEEFPSVSLRINKKYVSQNINAGSLKILSFESGNNTEKEKSAFALFNQRIYSFVVTGSDIEEINRLFDYVMKTVEFK